MKTIVVVRGAEVVVGQIPEMAEMRMDAVEDLHHYLVPVAPDPIQDRVDHVLVVQRGWMRSKFVIQLKQKI